MGNLLACLVSGSAIPVTKEGVSGFASGGAVASFTVENFRMDLADAWTTEDTNFDEIDGSNVDKPTITNGKTLMVVNCGIQNSGDGKLYLLVKDDSANVQYIFEERGINADTTISGGDQSDADGQTYTLWSKADSGITAVHPGLPSTSNRATIINGIGMG